MEGCWSLPWFLWPVSGVSCPGSPTCLTQRESKANLFFCSCLSNAPYSEAVLLFKPLKELRAKRKGTHLVVCMLVHFQKCFQCVVCMRVNLTEKMKSLKQFIFALRPVCFFCCFCVKECGSSFCFTERVSWNRWPSVILTSCVDSDKRSEILWAESFCVTLRVRTAVCIHHYSTGHHWVYLIFKDNPFSPLFHRLYSRLLLTGVS